MFFAANLVSNNKRWRKPPNINHSSAWPWALTSKTPATLPMIFGDWLESRWWMGLAWRNPIK